MFGEVPTELVDELQTLQQKWSRIVGKRFKSALVVAGFATVMLAVAGPIVALLAESHFRALILTVWVAAFGTWILATSCAVTLYLARRTARLLTALRRELAAKNNKDVIAEVRDTRVKQSRHEFKQELLLDRIDVSTSTLIGDLDSHRAAEVVPKLDRIEWHGEDGPKILFITSNGSGMGHLSRCLAVASEAEQAGCRTAILTLSTAYEVVQRAGYPVMYHPSSAASPWSLSVWNRSFARFLEQRFNGDRPDAVVFDGTAVYRGVTQICRRLEIPLVWLRRGMWKDEVSRVQYDRPFEVADFVIVPGEVTDEAEHEQNGVQYIGPITQANHYSLLGADDAKRALGLDPLTRYALVQVGTAEMNGNSAVELIVGRLNEFSEDYKPVVLVSPIAKEMPELPNGIVVHGRYPLAPYLRAFDIAVTSAGYNSVHENLAVGIPAVYVPNRSTVTDDQTARAERVEQAGMGLVARNEAELDHALRQLVDPKHRSDIREALDANATTDGASAFVQSLLNIIGVTQPDFLHADQSSQTRRD